MKWKLEPLKDYIIPHSANVLGKNILIGIILAIILVVINSLIPQFGIGFPYMPTATQDEQLKAILFYAPFGEESLFGGLFFPLLDVFFPLPIALLINGVGFSLFHATAYAGAFDVQGIQGSIGAFVSALIYRVIFDVMIFWRKSIYPSMIMHLTINGFVAISSGALVVLGIG